MFRRVLLALSSLSLLLATPAWACGGFFCNFNQPVDQSAERILYLRKGNSITVHIQISYTGDAKDFSWVLPLQKIPTLGTGSDTVFQVLEQFTAPTFQLQWKNKENCWGGGYCLADAAAGGGPPNADGGSKGVQVVAQGNVGPYDYVVLKGGVGKEVVDWLNANGYQQPNATAPLVDDYAKQNYVFLALKLTKDKAAGDLVPIVITLEENAPCLPLKLTALAAQPDMPVVAWVLAEARAIPKNFLHVELNEATLDWLQPGANYKTVVSQAVDLGSGHAWLTEFAQPTAKFQMQFASPQWNPTQDFAGVTTPKDLLLALLQKNYPRSTQVQNLVRKYIPKGEQFADMTDMQFYTECVQNGSTEGKCAEVQKAIPQTLDGKKFGQEMLDNVVKPLQDMDIAYKATPYLTRLYTTVSAEEMNKDPIFAFNKDLPDVSNVHTADAEPMCPADSKQATEVKLTFKDGHVLTVPLPKENRGPCWGWNGGGVAGFGKGTGPLNAAGGKALRKVQVLDEQGPPLDIDPSVADKVDAQLNFAKVGTPSLTAEFKASLPKVTWDPYTKGQTTPPPQGADAGGTTTTPPGQTGGGTASGDGGGCTAGATGGLGGLLLGLGAVVGLVRRRRVG